MPLQIRKDCKSKTNGIATDVKRSDQRKSKCKFTNPIKFWSWLSKDSTDSRKFALL
jgi:hypothetical protein